MQWRDLNAVQWYALIMHTLEAVVSIVFGFGSMIWPSTFYNGLLTEPITLETRYLIGAFGILLAWAAVPMTVNLWRAAASPKYDNELDLAGRMLCFADGGYIALNVWAAIVMRRPLYFVVALANMVFLVSKVVLFWFGRARRYFTRPEVTSLLPSVQPRVAYG
jgi:hypothetical protein